MSKLTYEDPELAEINNDILKVWKKYPGISERIPLLYTELNKEGLLFIGNNPSFVEKGVIARLKSYPEFQKYVDNLDLMFKHENIDAAFEDYISYLKKGRNSVMNGDYNYFSLFPQFS